MREYNIPDLLDKLIGSTEPYGESNHDSKAMDRLEDVEIVLEWVIDRLYECRRAKNNYQGSMFLLAREARKIAKCYIETFEDLAEMSDMEIEREKER